jgi:hypothetical protein
MSTDLMQKLMISKAIMDKHNEMPRGNNGGSIPSSVSVENFDAPQAKYNIPQSMISEQTPEGGVVNTKPVGDVSIDAIKKSKLPDAIKKLMLENPIQAAQQSRESQVPATLDMNHISMLVKEAVNEALKENGLLIESVENSNDIFSFKVGSHIFEGKITKVKKVK